MTETSEEYTHQTREENPVRSAPKPAKTGDVARKTLDRVIDILDTLEPADARLVAGWLFGRYVGWK